MVVMCGGGGAANNLWVDLEALKKTMDENGGVLPLPVIKNGKTVDPRDKKSTKVLQLETAMGAAIECFPGAQAILIPRSRFAPVKTTGDLLALMSDAYDVTDDYRMVLKAARGAPRTHMHALTLALEPEARARGPTRRATVATQRACRRRSSWTARTSSSTTCTS